MLGMGGAEKMCADLALELKRRGHEVIIICLYNEHTDISAMLEKKNIKLYYLEKKRGFDINCVLKIRKILNIFQPDVIHTHLYVLKYAFLASIGKGIPIIHTIHNIAKKESDKIDRLLNKMLFNMNLVVPVAISKKIKETIVKCYKLPSKSIPVIYNGISLNSFTQKNDYELHSPSRIIHVGRFQEQKNHRCIIESANKLKERNILFICIGEGELKCEIEKMIKDKNLNNKISCVGLTNNVNKYLNEGDIFILPSKWEGFPISIIEAMAVGIPIIASDVGGVSDIVKSHINGILIEPNSIQLSDSIVQLLDNKTLREEYGYNAKKTSEKFSVEKMTTRYIDLYQRK